MRRSYDERIYADATMNLAAELADLAHGGQTVIPVLLRMVLAGFPCALTLA